MIKFLSHSKVLTTPYTSQTPFLNFYKTAVNTGVFKLLTENDLGDWEFRHEYKAADLLCPGKQPCQAPENRDGL